MPSRVLAVAAEVELSAEDSISQLVGGLMRFTFWRHGFLKQLIEQIAKVQCAGQRNPSPILIDPTGDAPSLTVGSSAILLLHGIYAARPRSLDKNAQDQTRPR